MCVCVCVCLCPVYSDILSPLHAHTHTHIQDQYIAQLAEKQVMFENQLYQAHKEVERLKRDQLTHSLTGGPHNVSDIIRVQSTFQWHNVY